MDKENNQPEHIAIILDGNRRFAKRLMFQPWKGHEYGAEKVEKLLDWASELKVREFTLYVLSSENIKSRPKNELEYLFKLMRKEFRGMDREKLRKFGMKIKFIGNLSLLPEDLAESCRQLEKETSNNKNFIVNFCLAYGGRQEIINAVKKILADKISSKQVKEETFENALLLKSEPDMIIRTGGEKRTSNFLPWQSAYSEWFFLDKFWPEFEKQDLLECIEEFKKRKRNFGA